MNVYELIRGRRHYVAEERVKSYMYQLMKAMDHMHRNGIFHRCARTLADKLMQKHVVKLQLQLWVIFLV
jgi:renal tumor antigen